jgi:uncharacterized protein (DUF2267 family)
MNSVAPETLERGVERTHRWIDETASDVGTDDMAAAYRMLKAVLHATRDRLAPEEVRAFAAELPERLRWALYEHWDPSAVPTTYQERDEFLRRVAEEAELATQMEASFAVCAVVRVLRRHLPAGEIDRVIAALPVQLRGLADPTGALTAACGVPICG